jgi:NAD-dependent DNA ligase
MGTPLDEHGQPIIRAYSAKRLRDRNLDELLGLCKGFCADGRIDQSEAEYLLQWLKANENMREEWPGNMLYARAVDYMRDGVLDKEESLELFDLLQKAAGKILDAEETSETSIALPCDDPLPKVEFAGMNFCLTGKFAYGSRKECESEVLRLGGETAKTVSGKTNYVVIGFFCSSQWAHTSYGRKIEKAVQMREAGKRICIVPEHHWTNFII